MIVAPNHQAAWEDSNAPFKDAHIYVHLKAVYILALEQGRSECNNCRVCAAQKFLHIMDVGA